MKDTKRFISSSQAFNFALELFENCCNDTEILLYDNGCKLLKYIEEKSKTVKTERFEKLKTKRILVDRFHF